MGSVPSVLRTVMALRHDTLGGDAPSTPLRVSEEVSSPDMVDVESDDEEGFSAKVGRRTSADSTIAPEYMSEARKATRALQKQLGIFEAVEEPPTQNFDGEATTPDDDTERLVAEQEKQQREALERLWRLDIGSPELEPTCTTPGSGYLASDERSLSEEDELAPSATARGPPAALPATEKHDSVLSRSPWAKPEPRMELGWYDRSRKMEEKRPIEKRDSILPEVDNDR